MTFDEWWGDYPIRYTGILGAELNTTLKAAARAAWEAAMSQERERCARIAEREDGRHDPYCCDPLARGIAESIREGK